MPGEAKNSRIVGLSVHHFFQEREGQTCGEDPQIETVGFWVLSAEDSSIWDCCCGTSWNVKVHLLEVPRIFRWWLWGNARVAFDLGL